VLLTTLAQEQADSCYRREQLALQQHGDLVQLHTDLGGTLKVTLVGEPTVKVGNWESAPSGGTVELTSAAKSSVAEGDKRAIVFLVGALTGFGFFGLLWSLLRSRR
jgi:hypothetical protein